MRKRRRSRYRSRHRRKGRPRYSGRGLDANCMQLALIHSIAREELALAKLIHGEARKTKSLAGKMFGPFTPDEVIAFQHSVGDVLEKIVRKEKLLLRKLRLVLHWRKQENGDDQWCIPDE